MFGDVVKLNLLINYSSLSVDSLDFSCYHDVATDDGFISFSFLHIFFIIVTVANIILPYYKW